MQAFISWSHCTVSISNGFLLLVGEEQKLKLEYDGCLLLKVYSIYICSYYTLKLNNIYIYLFHFAASQDDFELRWINNTPRVDGNTVTADLAIGTSFQSVMCRVTTRRTQDCKNALYKHVSLQYSYSHCHIASYISMCGKCTWQMYFVILMQLFKN